MKISIKFFLSIFDVFLFGGCILLKSPNQNEFLIINIIIIHKTSNLNFFNLINFLPTIFICK